MGSRRRAAQPPSRGRPNLLWIGGVLALLQVVMIGAFWLAYRSVLGGSLRIPSSAYAVPGTREPGHYGHFQVRHGESFDHIASTLKRDHWVRAVWPVRWEALHQGWDRRVIPGYYRVRPGESVRELLQSLAQGEIERTKVTIPEGWRLDRVLRTLADSTWVPIDSLNRKAGDARWLAGRQVPGPGLEGYLFPETYVIAKGESAGRVLDQLLKPGLRLWEDSLAARAGALGLSQAQLWTLASIIEAEAARPQERARISAVFWNRLRRGMRLESDPTVQYALGRQPGRLLYSDLEVNSPYNTYRVTGLPPGPICSPGRASLAAALHPDTSCADLFFVARGDGTHVFSRTLREHNRARQVVRRGANIRGG
jgi:UPF0755 protein